jgi:hypothetical protein
VLSQIKPQAPTARRYLKRLWTLSQTGCMRRITPVKSLNPPRMADHVGARLRVAHCSISHAVTVPRGVSPRPRPPFGARLVVRALEVPRSLGVSPPERD